MPLATALAKLNASLTQCDSLIANAHRQDASGAHIFTPLDRQQITEAAFLNMFIAWEAFIEESILSLMSGASTLSGRAPTRFVIPATTAAASKMIVGVMKYFDYSHHLNVSKMCSIFFDNAYPFEPHLSSISSDLQDLKKLRNRCAHITSSTKRDVENIALRIFGAPQAGISVYALITSPDPRNPPDTVYLTYKKKLEVVASLIANG